MPIISVTDNENNRWNRNAKNNNKEKYGKEQGGEGRQQKLKWKGDR